MYPHVCLSFGKRVPYPHANERARKTSSILTPAAAGVQTVAVSADEAGMRVDRFLEARPAGYFPFTNANI
jgi:hypothetical protein